MSFLWRGSTDSENSLCKNCTDKEKRIQDYEVFFNETKDVLKKKDESLTDATVKMAEKISEIELLKKLYEQEKKNWNEDRKIWMEQKKVWQNDAMEWEVEKSKYEEQLEEFSNSKMIWQRTQKILEEKISGLVIKLKESDSKYQDLVQRVTEQNVLQSDEIREREEDIISVYDRRIEDLIDEFDKKELEWKVKENDYETKIEELVQTLDSREIDYKNKESDYEDEINRLTDNILECEMKIAELRYDCQIKDEEFECKFKEQDEKWSNRVMELNESYDNDFIQFKQHFKNKEQNVEKTNEELLKSLKSEIELLRKENEDLEKNKRQVEKKITEINLENRGLKADNEWLEREWINEQEEKNNLEKELETNKKTLQESVIKIVNRNTLGTQTEILPTEGSSLVDLDSEPECSKKKRNPRKRNQFGNGSYVPYVEQMNKYEEKKTISRLEEQSDHVVIEICDPNFFLPKPELENKIKSYEEEIQKLKHLNTEYLSKIKTYECKSILQLNRNLRTGIPVRFFPHHSNTSVLCNQINSVELDLH
jgi:chromosome segregation ATPase